MQTFVYGTGNAGKIQFMREVFEPLGLNLISIGDLPLVLPVVDESGNSPLENARIKALAYYKALREQTDTDYPVFSCDSGLYIEGLRENEQPGVHVRRVNGKKPNRRGNDCVLLLCCRPVRRQSNGPVPKCHMPCHE